MYVHYFMDITSWTLCPGHYFQEHNIKAVFALGLDDRPRQKKIFVWLPSYCLGDGKYLEGNGIYLGVI